MLNPWFWWFKYVKTTLCVATLHGFSSGSWTPAAWPSPRAPPWRWAAPAVQWRRWMNDGCWWQEDSMAAGEFPWKWHRATGIDWLGYGCILPARTPGLRRFSQSDVDFYVIRWYMIWYLMIMYVDMLFAIRFRILIEACWSLQRMFYGFVMVYVGLKLGEHQGPKKSHGQNSSRLLDLMLRPCVLDVDQCPHGTSWRNVRRISCPMVPDSSRGQGCCRDGRLLGCVHPGPVSHSML